MKCKNISCNNIIDSHSIICKTCIDKSFNQPYNFIDQSIINQIETSYSPVEKKTIKEVYKQVTMYDIPNFY